LAVPDIPAAEAPTGGQFLWAIVIGVLAGAVGSAIRRLALGLQPVIERRMVLLTPVAGLAIGVLALVFVEATDRPAANVLFSGQDQLPSLVEGAADWTVGALVLLFLCKGLAYVAALSCFRGGPVFPGMFIGAVGGIALAHLPGLPTITGAAMGIGAMTASMLGLPLVAVLLVGLFLSTAGLQVLPLVIVAVAVSYVVTARLTPRPSTGGSADPAPGPGVAAS